MKVAVFSDTHTNTARMVKAVRQTKPDAIIHLGDHQRDTLCLQEEFPEIPLYCVRGNCDISSDAPDKAVVQLGPVKHFLPMGICIMSPGAPTHWSMLRWKPAAILRCSATPMCRKTPNSAASRYLTPVQPGRGGI